MNRGFEGPVSKEGEEEKLWKWLSGFRCKKMCFYYYAVMNESLLFHFYHIFRYHCYRILAPDSKVHKHPIYSLLTESCFQSYTVFVFWHAGGMLLKTYTFLSTGVKPVKQSGSFGQKDNNKLSIFNLKCHHNVGKRLQDRFISLSTS